MTYYLYNYNTGETLTYDNLYDLLGEVIDETYIKDLLDELYTPVYIPSLGDIPMSILVEELGKIHEAIEDEIDAQEDEVLYTLGEAENPSEVYSINGYAIFNSEKIKGKL